MSRDGRGVAAVAGAAGVVVALVRRMVSSGRTEYAIWPDEPAQLAMARFLGGGTRWTMHDHSTWRPGFAVLLSPIHWFTDDSTTVLRAALTLNAILGGIAAALMVVLALRLTSLSTWQCAGAAVFVSLMPSLLFTTDFAWSEGLLVPLFLGTLLALLRFDDRPSLLRGLTVSGLCSASFFTHSRMLPLAVVALTLFTFVAYERRLRARDGVVLVGATGAGVVVAGLVTRLIVDALWRQPAENNSVSAVVERATDVGAVVVSFAGQAWYLLVSTLGLVGFGVWGLVRSVRSDRSPAARRDAVIVLLTVGSCVALSVVFMSARLRPDRVVYGRYDDAVIAPVLLVGVCVLLDRVPVRRFLVASSAVLTATLVAAATIVTRRGDALAEGNGIEPMILGLQPYIFGDDRIDVVRITAAAMVVGIGAVGLVALAVRRRFVVAIAALVLVALLVVGGVRTNSILDRGWDDRGDYSAVEAIRDVELTDGTPVDFFLPTGSDSTERLLLYQMYLPQTEFTVVDDLLSGATADYLFADEESTVLADSGATLVWTDPDHPWGLWRRNASSITER